MNKLLLMISIMLLNSCYVGTTAEVAPRPYDYGYYWYAPMAYSHYYYGYGSYPYGYWYGYRPMRYQPVTWVRGPERARPRPKEEVQPKSPPTKQQAQPPARARQPKRTKPPQ